MAAQIHSDIHSFSRTITVHSKNNCNSARNCSLDMCKLSRMTLQEIRHKQHYVFPKSPQQSASNNAFVSKWREGAVNPMWAVGLSLV